MLTNSKRATAALNPNSPGYAEGVWQCQPRSWDYPDGNFTVQMLSLKLNEVPSCVLFNFVSFVSPKEFWEKHLGHNKSILWEFNEKC